MSIWDNMKRSDSSRSENKKAGSSFTIHFSTESVEVEAGTSLRDALMQHAVALGYDGSRRVTWRDSRGVVADSTGGKAGAAYTASVALETKGL